MKDVTTPSECDTDLGLKPALEDSYIVDSVVYFWCISKRWHFDQHAVTSSIMLLDGRASLAAYKVNEVTVSVALEGGRVTAWRPKGLLLVLFCPRVSALQTGADRFMLKSGSNAGGACRVLRQRAPHPKQRAANNRQRVSIYEHEAGCPCFTPLCSQEFSI